MSKIEFISHDYFPEDEYTKELVYLCLEGKYRVAFVRKASKSGGMFWSVVSAGATRNGLKEYFPAFMQDSNFLERDIKDFLDKRKWENTSSIASSSTSSQNWPPRSMDELSQQDDQMPF